MFKAIFDPKVSVWNEIQEQGMPIDPLELGKEFDVEHSKIKGNLNILVDGKVVGSFPSDWFTY